MVLLVWATFAFGSNQPVCSQESGNSLVVLLNGQIIAGKVQRLPSQVIVETRQGSRIILQNDRVDFVCGSLEEAYWEKCARTKASDVNAQKELFEWCLKNQLLEQAQLRLDLLVESELKSTELSAEHCQFSGFEL